MDLMDQNQQWFVDLDAEPTFEYVECLIELWNELQNKPANDKFIYSIISWNESYLTSPNNF